MPCGMVSRRLHTMHLKCVDVDYAMKPAPWKSDRCFTLPLKVLSLVPESLQAPVEQTPPDTIDTGIQQPTTDILQRPAKTSPSEAEAYHLTSEILEATVEHFQSTTETPSPATEVPQRFTDTPQNSVDLPGSEIELMQPAQELLQPALEASQPDCPGWGALLMRGRHSTAAYVQYLRYSMLAQSYNGGTFFLVTTSLFVGFTIRSIWDRRWRF